MMKKSHKIFLINKNISAKDAMRRMSENGEKVLFINDENNCLYGALSNGDIRRWILSGGKLDASKVTEICNRDPKTVNRNYDINKVKRYMLKYGIEAIPILDDNKRVIDVLRWEEVFAGEVPKTKGMVFAQVVIMAGGKGTRLDPFTRILPKPLIPIGEKPVIEIIMDKFYEHGINDFYLSINDKARMIKSYFEEIKGKFNISYIEEKTPLGTIGSLRLLKGIKKMPLIVTNCDIIIDSDYAEIVGFHKKNNLDITIVVSCKNYVIPYGICEIENGGMLNQITEKPEYDLLVSTGMYVMKNSMIKLIPKNKHFNATELINKAKSMNYKVGVFPISERSWIDVGQWEEYHKTIKQLGIK